MLRDGDYDRRMVIADIPGLIQGAHLGAGLGHRFLKHLERTRFLVHILSAEYLDAKSPDPWEGFDLINEELRRFDESLAAREQIEVVNKIDLLTPDQLATLRQKAEAAGREIYFVSALYKQGLEELTEKMWVLQAKLNLNPPLDKAAAPEAACPAGGA
jgi:GTP-binding protein